MLDDADGACCIAPCVPAAAATAALLVVCGDAACLLVSVCVCLTAC
eukprot:COSAG06_NODE_62160_length_265_cov_2.957831_1_plen_45_part_01